MANNGIGILFQVAGGGSISGKSGQLIKSQLETLSSNIKLKINIDREHFSSQLGSLKAEIQKQLGTLNVNFHTNQGSSGGNGSGTSGANGENQAYQQLKATLNSIGSLRQKLASQVRSQSQEATELQAQVNEKYAEYTRLVEQNKGTLSTDQLNSLEQLKQKIDATAASQERLTAARRQDKLAGAETSYRGLYAQAQQLLTNNNGLIKSNKDAAATAEQLRSEMGKEFPSDNYEEAVQYNQNLARAVKDASARFGDLSQRTDTIGHKFKETFKSKLIQTFAYALIGLAVRALKQVYTNVVEIDTAMTQLKIVTKANSDEMESYAKTVADSAKRIGASITDLVNATTTYARLGFTLTDSARFAELTTAYSKVADVGVDDATKNITAIIKAYNVGADQLEAVIDKLIYVGRKYAISSAEIGEGMNNAASALVANHNSLEQALGILTAANVTAQNISRASTGARTIAARLSASKAELESLGEDTEGVETVAKLAETFRAFGIEIEKGNGDLYSTYEILAQIAARWSVLNDEERNTITNLAAGTRQQDIFMSIIQNWGDAQSIVQNVNESTGELANATAERLDSIQGKLDQMKAIWQEFSTHLLESSLVKFIVDILNLIANGVNGVATLIQQLGGLKTALLAFVTVLALVKGGLIAYNLQLKITAGYTALITLFQKLRRGLLMVMDIIPNAIIAWKSYAAGVVSASTAMQASIPVIGLVLAAVTLLVGALSLYANNAKETAEESVRAADDAAKLGKEITSLTTKYLELSDAVAAGVQSREDLMSTQDELIDKLGVERTRVRELADEYGNYTDAVKYAAIEKLKEDSRDLSGGLNIKEKALLDAAKAEKLRHKPSSLPKNYQSNLVHMWGFTENKLTNDEKAALAALNNSPYFSAYGGDNAVGSGGYTIQISGYSEDDLGSVNNVLDAYGKLGQALDIVKETSGSNNSIYKALYKQYNALSEVVGNYKNAIGDLNANSAEQYVLGGLIGKQIPKTQDEFEAYRQEVIASAQGSNDFIGSTEDIIESIDAVLRSQTQFAKFYQDVDKDIEDTNLKLKSVATILNSISGEYDSLVNAMSDMEEYGVLTAKTFTSMIKDYPDLIKYLQQTENGYILNANALEEYVQGLIDAYTAEAALAAMTAENKEIAIQNLKNLQTALAMLAVSSNKVQSDSSARKKALQDEKDALRDQLDAYKELIDLRKKLLQQYEDELQYKRELEKKEKRVATLQTQYAISQLDTTAAGRAKTRQLAQDLAEAQEDLDDYTLEHAIDVVTNELDSQYEEYKRWIDGKIDDIEDKIDALGTSNTSDSNGVSAAIAAAAASAASKISDAIAQIEITPVVNGGGGGSGGGTTGGGRWTSYKDAANAGYSNIRTEHEFARGGSDKEKYGTYQAYLDAMYDKYVGDNPKLAAIAAAQSYVSSHGMLEGDKNRWGQDPNFLPLLRALIAAGGSINDLHGKTNTVRGNTGVYHSGGIVGDFTNLRSTEMFAKLLKGEFVATPAMMETFMNHTLPAVAGIGGSNAFNAPLISIQCDNVTQESLPKLKDIIEEAVQEIKKQLDGGLSRAGYRKPAKKITI